MNAIIRGIGLKRVTIAIVSLFFVFAAHGQRIVTGTVSSSASGETLPGVNVVVQGTTRGAITDINGNYQIELLPEHQTLIFSFVGFEQQIIAVGNRQVLNVELIPAATALEELVVIGYGAQRVRDLTAPIVRVSGDDLARQTTSNVLQALQGKAAGVQIIQSGAPGSGSTVRIRGLGSIGDYANPLFVVDGVFVDNIDFISSSDIEDVTILKDASAAAIFGVRAANGVILITTRKGRIGRPTVSYDGFFGMQVPVNILPLANTQQYVQLFNEANVNRTGFVPKDPAAFPASTDWYGELLRLAPMTSHSFDISGAGTGSNYSIGGSFLNQLGIMNFNNHYQRLNLRARFDQTVNDYIKIGINSFISRHDQYRPNDGAFFQAFVNPPVYPVIDENNLDAFPRRFGSPQLFGFGNQYGNPFAAAYYPENFERGSQVIISAYAEFYPIRDRLTFRTSYHQTLNSYNQRNFMPEFNVGGSQGLRNSTLNKISGTASRQIIDNLLTFTDSRNRHNYSILLGQSARIERNEFLGGFAENVPGFDDQSKYISTGSFVGRNAWDGAGRFHGLSFFTRGTYSFADTYFATFTFRADGSSKYQQKWGYFPSIGLGWNITNADFMQNQTWFSHLKARASWGMLGNDNIPANSQVILGRRGPESSGIFGNRLVDGMGAQTVMQNYLRWEVVREFNFGFDFIANDPRFGGDLDFYYRTTDNVVFFAPIATGGGVAELLANNGKVLNAGIELMLNWADDITDDLSYSVSFNATTIHNRVLALEGREFIPGAFVRGNFTTRTQVGHPIGSFFGFEIDGVFESEAEALRHPVSQAIKDRGFFIYRDQNGDNVIDDNDKVFLGSPLPWLISGLDFRVNYRRFDFGINLYAQVGNKILNAKRMMRDIFADGNYDLDFYRNRWTNDNRSNTYPSAEAFNFSFTQQANDFFVEDGSFFRIQNIQVGYTLENIPFIPSLRIYLAAQRPFSFFTYNGFTPEIAGSPISSGVDFSVHPMQAIYTFGFRANF